MIKKFLYIILLLPICIGAQNFELPKGKKYEKIGFKLINNLIVIPAKVNGASLSFVLDTGVSVPILFNLSSQDSVEVKNTSKITIKGLGEGEAVEALSSYGNIFELKSIKNNNQKLYVILDDKLNFSPKLGVPIHGILGYDFFKNFIIEINYANRYLKVYKPNRYTYKSKKNRQTLDLIIEKKKAYVTANAFIGEIEVPVKLLLDTGSSDAVWLFEDENKGISVPTKNFKAFLGRGLNGDIYGKRTKIDKLNLGMFSLKNAKTAFPDSASVKFIKRLGTRNGSVGGDVLKRFNLVLDYPNNKITLKKNSNFNKPFWFNTSGMDLEHGGMRYTREKTLNKDAIVGVYKHKISSNNQVSFDNEIIISLVPEIVISNVREDSPAKLAGLKVGDVIIAVNKKSIHDYKLQEITQMVDGLPGKKVNVLVERRGEKLRFNLRIKKLF